MIPGRIYPLRSTGVLVLVRVTDSLPHWFPSAGAARSFLLDLDLRRACERDRDLVPSP